MVKQKVILILFIRSSKMLRVHLFSVVLFFLLCTQCSQAEHLDNDVNRYAVELVQVVHRHGARSPIANHNETSICGLTYPCGILNKEGQRMVENLGVFIRNRYNDLNISATPFFPSEAYNLSRVLSRSTDIQRTLQSSAGVLRGIFPNLTEFYPAIHTVPFDSDWLLNSGVIPEIHARHSFGRARRNETCAKVAEALPAVIYAAAAEVHSESFCEEKDKVTCAFQLCDIGQAYKATGVLSQYPNLEAHLALICKVVVCSNTYYFNYNPAMGSFGQPLAQELLQNIRTYITNPSYRLIEYSGHDTTITPLAATLGNMSDLMLDPPFASAFFFELLKSNDKYFIRVLFGFPSSPGFDFNLVPFSFQCMKDKKVYIPQNNICPLEDFISFIDSTKPMDPRGLCIVDDLLVPNGYCNEGATRNSSFCLAYRKVCPDEGHNNGHASSECHGNVPQSSSLLAIWILIVGTMVFGVAYMVIKKRRAKKKSHPEPRI